MLYYDDLFEIEDIVELILSYIDGLSLLMIGKFNKTLHNCMKNRVIEICKIKKLPKFIIDKVVVNSDWRALVIAAYVYEPTKCGCLRALLGTEFGWQNISVNKVSILNIDKNRRPDILPYGEAVLLYGKDGIDCVKICGVEFMYNSRD